MGDRGTTLVDVLVARAEQTPDRPAYTYLTGETLDYGELYRRAATIAFTVASATAPGDRVLVPSVFGPPFVTAFFGCLLAARIPVPAAYTSSAAGTAAFTALAADCDATAVLAPEAYCLEHGTLTRLVSDAPGEPIAEPVRPGGDDIAFLQYTSGTTRSPRGVAVSHANLMHNLDAIAHAFGAEPDHHVVSWLPPHHGMGLVGALLAPVHTGCPVTLMSPTAFLRDPLAWLRTVAESGRAVSGGPNLCYEHAVRKVAPADVEDLDLSRWDVALVGAEPVNPAVLDRFARHFAPAGFRPESFLPCHGLAESTLLVSAAHKELTTAEPAPATNVRLSLFCFASDPEDTGKHALFLECARFADERGFHAIWVPERNFPRFGGPFPTPAVLGAALATTTSRLRIRPGSVVVPDRDAVSTAQEWTVVDNLSHGRVDLAFAAEYQHELLAGARKVRRMWRGGPWLLCVGGTDRFAQAGAAGAHVLTPLSFQDTAKLGTKIAAYRNARAAHGHDPGHFTVLLDLRASSGMATHVAARVERLAAAGVDELACLVDLSTPRDEVLAELAHLAELLPAPAATRHGDVFAKAREFDRTRQVTDADLMPFHPVEHAGRELIMLGANDYLGLTADPRVREATAAAALAQGVSRLNSSTPAQRDLERALARFVGRQDALLFATGYEVNIGLLSAFLRPGTVLVADEECHACVYDGVAVGGGRFVQFRHNDVADLDQKLATAGAPAMVMVDGVYSMSGDLAPLRELREICDRHGVPLAVDDAHGLGTAGPTGRGVEEELGVLGCADVLTGTLSESLASVGGWLAGPADLVDYVRFHGRFSSAIAPPAVAAAAAALEILAAEPDRVAKLRELTAYWRAGLSALGFDTGTAGTTVVPVNIGDELVCRQFARRLLDSGVHADCVLPPAVPANHALIRTTVTAAHEKHHLDRALEVFAEAGRELGFR
ncbi:aminotransferase class I/II-fold pyridoxal phosphate-dependent enzyme [Actinophytocola sp.]|uniref:aminotransferase class I/II-fold pyridoxal phosphate-dependent enzyme n=1 Tax=Actinophytocola sp. TaxID=1872138 RepID=UPI002ED06C92